MSATRIAGATALRRKRRSAWRFALPTDGARTAAGSDLAPALPKDFLRPCLLLLLREDPAHGYDLLERLATLGFRPLDPGGLYRTLRRLEQDGLVHSAWMPSQAGPQRRIYEITRSGMEELHLRAQALAGGARVVDAMLARYEEFVALRR